jgi:hypothetical protein
VGAAALAATAIGMSGCVGGRSVAGVSETCTQPTTLNDGFFASRSVFFRISTQTDPTDPRTTWICYRVRVSGQPEQAGRIDVNPNDTSSLACTTTPGNGIPTPHPIEQGEVLETPFYIDAYAKLVPAWSASGLSGGNVWLCVEAGPVKQRVAIDLGTANDPDLFVNTDPAPPAPQDTTPPPAGKASTSCSAGAYGPATELVNAHLSGRDLFLYTAKPADDELHVCARLSSPQASGGGHLAVKAAASQVVDVQQSTDVTPCTQDVVVLSNPPMAIRTTPVGQTPPSICVNGTRYTIVTGPIPPVVSFTPDA